MKANHKEAEIVQYGVSSKVKKKRKKKLFIHRTSFNSLIRRNRQELRGMNLLSSRAEKEEEEEEVFS